MKRSPTTLSILGIVSIGVGILLVFGVVGVILADDVPLALLPLFLLPEVLLVVDGGALLVLRSRGGQDSATNTSVRSEESQGDGSHEAQDADKAQGAGAGSAQGAGADAAAGSPGQTVNLFARSSDVFATARDLARSYRSGSAQARGQVHLASMLCAMGILEWDDAPEVEAALIRRTNLFWLRGSIGDLGPEDYARASTVEAAMNIDLELPRLANRSCDEPEVQEAVDAYLRSIVDQKVPTLGMRPELALAYPQPPERGDEGEWAVRESLTRDAELLRVPFRFVYDIRTNVRAGVALVRVEVPSPDAFAIVTDQVAGRASRARAYALRLAWLVASRMFASSPRVAEAHVACCAHASDESLLEVSFTRNFLDHMEPIVRDPRIEDELFPHDSRIRATFGDDGWFVPFEPGLPLDDPRVSPAERFQIPELDMRPLSPSCARLCGAKHVRDLSINEHGTREHALVQLSKQWRALERPTNEGVVASLMKLRDETDDVTVAEACDRVVSALLEGEVDPADTEGMGKLFVWGGTLEQAVRRVTALFETSDELDPHLTISILREALEPVMAVGFYADDESAVYRYFSSMADRLVFNTRIDDHQREVRLVPDAYFNALTHLCAAQTALELTDDAHQTADELMRIAPNCMSATLSKVRVLESESRIFEAAELIQEALEMASNPRDAALGHYRLAYMEWRLGKEDLAVACYQQALEWPSGTAASAREELDDLLRSSDGLHRLEPEEVRHRLEQEGIPKGYTDEDQATLLSASALLVDDEAFVPAQQLLAIVCSVTGDDVLTGVFRSLEGHA